MHGYARNVFPSFFCYRASYLNNERGSITVVYVKVFAFKICLPESRFMKFSHYSLFVVTVLCINLFIQAEG